MAKKIIMLDPGHGWSNKLGRYGRPITTIKDGKAIIIPDSMQRHEKDGIPGYYREDFGTLAIAKAAKEALEELEYETHLTRSLDNDLSAAYNLADELEGNSWKRENWKPWRWIKEATNHYKCDAFISIHTNAGGGTGVTGFYAEGPGKVLATFICAEIANRFKLNIRRIVNKKYSILKNSCKGNACLIECAFHDHPNDLKLLLDPKNIEEFGKLIAVGIDKFLSNA